MLAVLWWWRRLPNPNTAPPPHPPLRSSGKNCTAYHAANGRNSLHKRARGNRWRGGRHGSRAVHLTILLALAIAVDEYRILKSGPLLKVIYVLIRSFGQAGHGSDFLACQKQLQPPQEPR